MPDTDELRNHFGQHGQQQPGCGFPTAHFLAMFDAAAGLLIKALAAPLRTHDMSQVSQLLPELSAGTVLVADRGFSDILRCQSVAGVLKELTMFALVYNLVRLVMLSAAEAQQIPLARISFVDALRWLVEACHDEPELQLTINPVRLEPRVRKCRPKEYPLMKLPRCQLRQLLIGKRDNA